MSLSDLGPIEQARLSSFLEDSDLTVPLNEEQQAREYEEGLPLSRRVWNESKKLWQIVGPAIFTRVSSYSMFIITQAFAGHLGDVEFAALSIGLNVILGFDIGLMVICVFSFVYIHNGCLKLATC